MSARADITGLQFGRLTAIRHIGSCSWGRAIWRCLCTCGKDTAVTAKNLRNGHTRSCGCLLREVLASRESPTLRHGMTGMSIHKAWISMRSRCFDSRNPCYPSYGGRGIRICKRWDSFEQFAKDMGQHPGRSFSLDRIDNNGNYTPKNCRWATRKEQQRNRRCNHEITVRGRKATIAEWAEITGISKSTIRMRIMRGVPPTQAVTR